MPWRHRPDTLELISRTGEQWNREACSLCYCKILYNACQCVDIFNFVILKFVLYIYESVNVPVLYLCTNIDGPVFGFGWLIWFAKTVDINDNIEWPVLITYTKGLQ